MPIKMKIAGFMAILTAFIMGLYASDLQFPVSEN